MKWKWRVLVRTGLGKVPGDGRHLPADSRCYDYKQQAIKAWPSSKRHCNNTAGLCWPLLGPGPLLQWRQLWSSQWCRMNECLHPPLAFTVKTRIDHNSPEQALWSPESWHSLAWCLSHQLNACHACLNSGKAVLAPGWKAPDAPIICSTVVSSRWTAQMSSMRFVDGSSFACDTLFWFTCSQVGDKHTLQIDRSSPTAFQRENSLNTGVSARYCCIIHLKSDEDMFWKRRRADTSSCQMSPST